MDLFFLDLGDLTSLGVEVGVWALANSLISHFLLHIKQQNVRLVYSTKGTDPFPHEAQPSPVKEALLTFLVCPQVSQ